MDYKVLYRKYRPNDFSSIIGQNYMVTILKNAIKKNKISHAYIFSGPRGTGKTSTAKVFAKAINCLNPTENGPCGTCDSCVHFKENADIIEMDAASNNGVDEIREIINNIKLAPAYSKYKVYIIDEVHMLSTSAFNALLLTLEEPPGHVVFILATTNIESVPITILSRCQRFDFHKINDNEIIKRLEYVTEQEKISIEHEALEEIAYLSEGGMRDALSILDQLSSNNEKITINEVISHFGSISKKQINDLFMCIINNDINKFIDIITNLKNISVDYKILIKKILERITEEAINCKKDNNYHGLEYSYIKEMAFELSNISNYININIDPYLLIEITLLKYFNIHKNVTTNNTKNITENAHKTTENNEVNLINNTPKIISQKPSICQEIINSKIIQIDNELIKIRINNCFASAKKEYLQNIKNNWTNFIQNIPDKKLLNLLLDSNIVAAGEKDAIITNIVEGTVALLNENIETISRLYQNSYQHDYKFIAITEEKWQEEKQIYVQNIKNKVQYIYQEEPQPVLKKADTPVADTENIEKTALDLFDKDIVEIE